MNIRSKTLDLQNATDSPWLKRMGLVGFSFFFIKGMLWILIPLLAHSVVF
jgi:hypothetical protein